MNIYHIMTVVSLLGLYLTGSIADYDNYNYKVKINFYKVIMVIIFVIMFVFSLNELFNLDEIENGRNRVEISTPDLGQKLAAPSFEQSISD